MKKQPTIEDVARKAGLSISTVSLVLNDKPNVSETTRRKVKQVIRRLGYHPHRGARGLASKLSGNIGFILTDDHFLQTEPFYTRIFLGTEFAARDLNYYILLTTVGREFTPQRTIPRFLLERNVDGVIIAGKISEKYIDHIAEMGMPVVLVDYVSHTKKISSVLIDNRRGAAEAVGHLIAGGRRHIAFLGGDIDHPSIAERHAGYEDALRAHKMTPVPALCDTVEPETGAENGERGMGRLLQADPKPDAVFAANDALALGAMRRIRAAGLRIPRDIAVAGFDDIEISSQTDPPLTTVRVHKEEMGKAAVRRVIELIRSGTDTVVTIHVPVELVVRESTGQGSRSPVDAVIAALD